jgi:hypothetical protein
MTSASRLKVKATFHVSPSSNHPFCKRQQSLDSTCQQSSRLHTLEEETPIYPITRHLAIMSSTSNSPISTGSYSPIFPKTLPSAEGYVNPPRAENPRLQSIIEHVRADHAQRPRASSANSISFRSASKTSQTYPAGTIRPRPPSLLRGASPPPARYAFSCLLYLSVKCCSPHSLWICGSLRAGSTNPTFFHTASSSLTAHCAGGRPAYVPVGNALYQIVSSNLLQLASTNVFLRSIF